MSDETCEALNILRELIREKNIIVTNQLYDNPATSGDTFTVRSNVTKYLERHRKQRHVINLESNIVSEKIEFGVVGVFLHLHC